MLEEFLNAVTGWAAADPRIEAALLVGSAPGRPAKTGRSKYERDSLKLFGKM